MRGNIYRVNCGNDFYVGSTVCRLNERFNKHIDNMRNNEKQSRFYNAMRCSEPSIELIEEIDVMTTDELRLREQYWIETLSPTLNTVRAYRTPELKKQQLRDCINRYKSKKVVCEGCQTQMRMGSLSRHKTICDGVVNGTNT